MEEIILQRTNPQSASDEPLSTEALKAGSHLRTRLSSLRAESNLSWGRSHAGTFSQSLYSAGIMLLCPMLVIFSWIALEDFGGSLFAAFSAALSLGPLKFAVRYVPHASLKGYAGYCAWLIFQAALYTFLPSKLSTGQLTPAGYLLNYYTNGLLAWAVTHALFAAVVLLGFLDPAIIAKNWAGLLVAANFYGYFLSAFAYAKAHLSPSHRQDRKFSGSWLYDFYMGIEFNPRFGRHWDFKLFHNGRPGIIAWTLIDLSFTAYQYQTHGYTTNSIIIADILHAIYVIDFFVNEDWYLRTIDICHDHFGFYLAWGSVVWLPSMYTLQTQYLARHPLVLSSPLALSILLTGVGGYVLFRSVNHQKDLVRKTDGDCLIWGKRAEVVRCNFQTSDGEKHQSLLLCSGWWGFSRHANYLGDLILSYSMCATCGLSNLLPWTYAIFMTILLIHRCRRDEERCAAKYGANWKTYTEKVRWKLVPGVY